MSTVLHLQQQGLAALLKAYLQAGAQPANLYIGLSTEATLSGNNLTFASLTEFAGSGYARIAVVSNSTNWPVANSGGASVNAGDGSAHPSVTFTNSSGSAWTQFTNCFLIDSSSGTGNILGYGPLVVPRVLQNGDSEVIVPQLTLTGS